MTGRPCDDGSRRGDGSSPLSTTGENLSPSRPGSQVPRASPSPPAPWIRTRRRIRRSCRRRRRRRPEKLPSWPRPEPTTTTTTTGGGLRPRIELPLEPKLLQPGELPPAHRRPPHEDATAGTGAAVLEVRYSPHRSVVLARPDGRSRQADANPVQIGGESYRADVRNHALERLGGIGYLDGDRVVEGEGGGGPSYSSAAS